MADSFDYYRVGEVVCDYVFDTFGIKKGDRIFFHHNITAEHIDYDGVRKKSDWCIDWEKNWYRIPKTEVYAYERDGEFVPVNSCCFLEPEYTYNIDPSLYPDIEIPNNKIEAKNYGRLVYINEDLRKAGLKEGDSVYFDKFSKYHFPVNGKDLWRMKNKWLIMKRNELQAEDK